MLISSAFQQLYNISDSIIAGKFAGKEALGAVGASYPITMIFLAFATGLSIGATVIISRYFGEKKNHLVKTSSYTSIVIAIFLSILLTGIGFLLGNDLLKLLRTDTTILSDSLLYLNIYTAGLLFLFIYNIANGIFISLGDSKTPLILLIISSVGNVLLDLLFVKEFNMGVSGVAYATLICQGVCSIIAFTILIKRLYDIKTTEQYKYFDSLMMKRILHIALPSILQQSIISLGNLVIQGLINDYGGDATAGYSAAIKLNTFAVTIFITMGNSVSSFTSQNLGVNNIKRVKSGYKVGMLIIFIATIPFTISYYFLGKELLYLFLDNNEVNANAINVGIDFLRIVSPFYIAVATKLVADGILRGSQSMNLFMITAFTDLIIRVILSIIFSQLFGLIGIWLSWPFGWILSTFLSQLFYAKGLWLKKEISQE